MKAKQFKRAGIVRTGAVKSRQTVTGVSRDSIVIAGRTSKNHFKSFRFTILSSADQMRQRNNAYTFFHID